MKPIFKDNQFFIEHNGNQYPLHPELTQQIFEDIRKAENEREVKNIKSFNDVRKSFLTPQEKLAYDSGSRDGFKIGREGRSLTDKQAMGFKKWCDKVTKDGIIYYSHIKGSFYRMSKKGEFIWLDEKELWNEYLTSLFQIPEGLEIEVEMEIEYEAIKTGAGNVIMPNDSKPTLSEGFAIYRGVKLI